MPLRGILLLLGGGVLLLGLRLTELRVHLVQGGRRGEGEGGPGAGGVGSGRALGVGGAGGKGGCHRRRRRDGEGRRGHRPQVLAAGGRAEEGPGGNAGGVPRQGRLELRVHLVQGGRRGEGEGGSGGSCSGPGGGGTWAGSGAVA